MPIGRKKRSRRSQKGRRLEKGLRRVMKIKDDLYGKWTREPPPDE